MTVNEALETIDVVSSSDPDDLNHDDLADANCADERDVDVQLEG